MIIISQDKTEIINFDNVNTLRATKTGFIVSYENTYKPEDDCSNILGKYETEEKAKEVLQKIYRKYEHGIHLLSSKSLSVQNILDYDFIYEMPEE